MAKTSLAIFRRTNWYICFVKRIFFVFYLVGMVAQGQVTPGKAITLSSASESIYLGEVIEGVRTISLWIKPSITIDGSNPIERPIVVRDENYPDQFATGEVNFYFGKTGTPFAGHVVFSYGGELSSAGIKSDATTWHANRWYHLAVVLHPQTGLRMYVNGVLQQETNNITEPFYLWPAGVFNPVYIGKWGTLGGYNLPATIDEFRLYTTALDEIQIRASMCAVPSPPYSGMSGYYNFDNATGNVVPNLTGGLNATPSGLGGTAFVPSNAPLGQTSSYLYNLTTQSAVQHMAGASLFVSNMQTNGAGVHLYSTYDPNLIQDGSHPYFFGVWFTDSVATYSATLDYSPIAQGCDSCAELKTRDYQTQTNWVSRGGFPQNCEFVLPQESPGVQQWREEYWLFYKRKLDIGLIPSITACEGQPITLSPKALPGARYYWEDGSTNRVRQVDTSGYYYVVVHYQGCIDTAGTLVKRNLMPVFSLGSDTVFCAGDTVVLEAPYFDSASYVWAGGLGFGRKFRVYFPGTISLVITVGDCSYSDEITLTMLRPFQVNLGSDTTLCLGEKYELSAPPNLKYTWSTGDFTRTTTVYNQSQIVWVHAWNECFSRTDTVKIDYEDCTCNFYVANTFSPNGDGDNDLFKPVTSCIYELYELEIYDRWGNRVFATINQDEGWDGTFQGKDLPAGVYSYQLRHKKFTSLADPQFERGMLNLIR